MGLYLYIIGINIFALLVMGYDKFAAKNSRYRVSEGFICLLALVLGAMGIYVGMLLFSHKTLKPLFRFGIPVLILLQLILLMLI